VSTTTVDSGHIFPKIYFDRGDTDGKFATVVTESGGNLTPVSATQVVNI
jgi:hypothetical protein